MHVSELLRRNEPVRTVKGSLFGNETEIKGEWVGQVEKRSEFVLTLRSKIPLYEGYYVSIFKFEDRDGNDVTWFAKEDKEMSVGNTYHIRAKVKRHTVYQDRRQTQIYWISKYWLKLEAVHLGPTTESAWDAI